jgi:hypothetical protein
LPQCEILLHCRRLELLDEGISQEAVRERDLSTEPFKDNYPVSPSKTPLRSNQRRRAARLMEGWNSLTSTHVYENNESKEKETGPSTTIQFKETSQPIIALSVGVEDTLKSPETIFKQSF